jgi:hypothetical protein
MSHDAPSAGSRTDNMCLHVELSGKHGTVCMGLFFRLVNHSFALRPPDNKLPHALRLNYLHIAKTIGRKALQLLETVKLQVASTRGELLAFVAMPFERIRTMQQVPRLPATRSSC